MHTRAAGGVFALVLSTSFALCQSSPAGDGPPIYRVTVVSRSVKAVNYQYRALPTRIDFRGTVLLPDAEGEATVESKRGRVEIDAKFEKLPAPTRFGREYMTYVLWAITPEGRPRSIGEIVPNGRNKASLAVTTDLQAFAMIVTAEPYAAVRQPSDVVVLENEVRSDTTGTVKDVVANYELLPRGHYTWHVPDQLRSNVNDAPKVSMSRYEALLALGEAQNAIGIARAAGAGQYAASTLARAEQLLQNARQLDAGKAESRRVVQSAREAMQTAEDARLIAERRVQDEKLAKATDELAEARRARDSAELAAERARIEASNARAAADAERAATQQAVAQLNAERERAVQNAIEARAAVEQAKADRMTESSATHSREANRRRLSLRMDLFDQMNGLLSTRDTPRGLVATIPDNDFQRELLEGAASEQLRRIAGIVAAKPGLKVEVEGHSDSPEGSGVSRQRANRVRELLIGAGVPNNMVEVSDRGASRPLVSNSTEEGRAQNRRVEIVISGDAIGTLPFWDRAYNLRPSSE
jgi:flagellar motor protein MotB